MAEPDPSLHPLLRRQIRRAGLSADAPDEVPGLANLIASVSRAYEDADQLRYLNDRAFALSETEQQTMSAELRSRAAEAARDRARMAAVFDAARTPFLVLSEAGVITDANQTAITALARRDGTGLVGQRLADALSTDADDVTARMRLSSLLAAVNEREAWSDELRLLVDDRSVDAPTEFRPFDRAVDAAGILSISVGRLLHAEGTGLGGREVVLPDPAGALGDHHRAEP